MQKRFWSKILISLVLLLSVYNALPTVFFYCQPLKDPINEQQALSIGKSISKRMRSLEDNTLDWLSSFCKTIKVDPISIKVDETAPHQIILKFKNSSDTSMFMKYLPRANAWIPFPPQNLFLKERSDPIHKRVFLERKSFFDFAEAGDSGLFSFISKEALGEKVSMDYQALLMDQITPVEQGLQKRTPIQKLLSFPETLQKDSSNPIIESFCQKTVDILENEIHSSTLVRRYFDAIFAPLSDPQASHKLLIKRVQSFYEKNRLEWISLQSEEQKRKENHDFLNDHKREQLEYTDRLKRISQRTLEFLQKHALGDYSDSLLNQESAQRSFQEDKNIIEIPIPFHPYVKALKVHLQEGILDVLLHEDLLLQNQKISDDIWINKYAAHTVHQELASLVKKNSENIKPTLQGFQLQLHTHPETSSFLVMKTEPLAKSKLNQVRHFLENEWNPQAKNLSNKNYPICDLPTYLNKPPEEQKVGFILYCPSFHGKWEDYSFKPSSFYLIAKGLPWIGQHVTKSPQSEEASLLKEDIGRLRNFLHTIGFFGYSGTTLSNDQEFWEDIVFENEDYLEPFLAATREDFNLQGSCKYAILEFSNLENRILSENKIAEQEHAELLKWRDDYQAAQLYIGNKGPFDVPPPTRSPFWNNLCLTVHKYFHGDEQRILHWGLDLSGGKSVLLELHHLDGSLVTSNEEIQQGIDDLYKRVNKLGVSEVDIRQEGKRINIDFPNSPGMTTEDLLKTSTLRFHLVNEKFTQKNKTLANHVNTFLRDVWSEALATGKTDTQAINAIAWSHVYGTSTDMNVIQPKSESAKILYENGLRLAPLSGSLSESRETFSDMFSTIQLINTQGNRFAKQEVPLLITFQNYALEGSSLSNIRGSYDPSRGHTLSFEVKKTQDRPQIDTFYPQENLHAWTSQFSKEKISGTPLSHYSSGDGWRMAVVLNNQIITAPTLSSAIKSAGSIEGNFSQRELQHLEMDLKAGSFTFVPQILSEKSVSADMGSYERLLGFVAFTLSLLFVVLMMLYVYRFGGAIAILAVICNLLIMWAILQNVGATVTFASIAGIILSVGMAVDANVLVFERIREELNQGKKIIEAIQLGYKKAFAAILDSNITTILSCLILLQFDSGPIKGFALTLLVGVISSMFTSLFMTRCFFLDWGKNPKHTHLNMVALPKSWNINFLKGTKPILFVSSLILFGGIVTGIMSSSHVIGIDFTGGYSLTIEFPAQISHSRLISRNEIIQALSEAHINEQNIQIREIGGSNHFRIFLSQNIIDDLNLPIAQIPDTIVQALKQGKLPITPLVEENIKNNWCEVSGKLSKGMYHSALYGLAISLVLIFFYVMIRFSFTFACSAIFCLIHDLFISLSFITIGNYFGLPVQLDLGTVAALMTIIGYSLNDTIVIFDRIREEYKVNSSKNTLIATVNDAISGTLSRTLMTSGTTLVALIPLVFLGNHAILGFSLVMISGVVFGTLSSIFIAAPLATWMTR